MKKVISLIACVVLLVGCSRGQKKSDAKKTPTKPSSEVSVLPKVTSPVPPGSPGVTGSPGVVGTAIPPAGPSPVVSVPPKQGPAGPSPVASVPPVAVAPAPGAPRRDDNGTPEPGVLAKRTADYLADISPVPLARMLRPESAAAKEVVKAQDLFRLGQTDGAIDILAEAIKNPDLNGGRTVFVRTQIAMLLSSGRVDEAKALTIQYATDEHPEFVGPIITRYLIEEKHDPDAAVAWTDQLGKLPLKPHVVTLNFSDRLVALSAADRLNEVIQNVPGIVEEEDGMKICVGAAMGMIKTSDFDKAESFLAAVEKASGDDPNYESALKFLNGMLESARASKTNAVPGA